ncbi:MAG: polysaccharide biosynthesis C-terminal domain-containing protein [Bacteroidota bacterium]|nr:polysaccharide biosynthesis C-terminal domain-containing protein [Bacteroidota bacterium]
MGVVIRQSIKGSVYSYLGAVIGFVNVGFLMPLLLKTNQIGLINVLVAMAVMISQFGTLGFVNVTLRFFPFFKTKDKKHHGFLKLLLLFGFVGFALCLIIFFLMQDKLIANNIDKSPLLAENIYYLIPFMLASLFYLLFDGFYRAIYRASTAAFFKDLFFRLFNLFNLGLYYFALIDFHTFLNLYVLSFASPAVLMFLHLLYIGEFRLSGSLRQKETGFYKKLAAVAFFGLISGFSGIAMLNIDKYMVNHFLDLDATGVYSIAFFFGSMIWIPGRAISRISVPILTDAFKQKDDNKVRDIYYKTTASMLLIGVILFVFLWANIHNVFRILPEAYESGRWVMFFIAIAFILNLASGFSNAILLYSNYYRLHSIMMISSVALIVILNIIFIPLLGITGAALATTLTYLSLGIFRWLFIWSRFGLQPFGMKHLVVVAGSLLILMLSKLIPELSLIPDLIIRSAFIGLCFLFFIKYSNVDSDFKKMAERILHPFSKH